MCTVSKDFGPLNICLPLWTSVQSTAQASERSGLLPSPALGSTPRPQPMREQMEAEAGRRWAGDLTSPRPWPWPLRGSLGRGCVGLEFTQPRQHQNGPISSPGPGRSCTPPAGLWSLPRCHRPLPLQSPLPLVSQFQPSLCWPLDPKDHSRPQTSKSEVVRLKSCLSLASHPRPLLVRDLLSLLSSDTQH